MSPFPYFLAGLLVGWLLQLMLEVLFFRRKTLQWRDQATKAVTAWTESEKQLAGLWGELAATKAELASTQATLSGRSVETAEAQAAPAVVALTPALETLEMAPCVEPGGTLVLLVEPASPAGLPPAAPSAGSAAVSFETAPAAATEISGVPVETASMRASALHGEADAVLAGGPDIQSQVSAPRNGSGSPLAQESGSVVGVVEASHAG